MISILAHLFIGAFTVVIGIIAIVIGCTSLGWPSGVFVPMLGCVLILTGTKYAFEGGTND